jgi:transposase InsO family protein
LPVPPGVFWEEISERSIKPKKKKSSQKQKGEKPQEDSGAASATEAIDLEEEEEHEVMMIEAPWMQSYLAYLVNKEIPADPVEARRVIRRSKAFTVIKGELYKRSISGVLQRCVTPEEGRTILKDIHEGICGHHASSRAIAAKAFRVGFYWLTAVEDTKNIVRTCDAYQRFASKPHAPAAELTPIPLAWPFAQWGLDMVGKLHKSWPGGHVYLLVAVDRFTKWIEAKPVTSADATAALNFIKDIVFRFGVPNSIVTDNGSNFTSREFKDYCEGLGIKLNFASVAHPQTNGQVEKANGLICNGIKKRLLSPLEKARHAWVDELPSVLWSLRTTPNAAQETPFFLVHGAEAVLLVELEHDSPRVIEYEEEASQKALEDDVDAADEARDVVLSRVNAYQQNLKNYHSQRLRPRSFAAGDLVLRLKQDGHEKLESPWTGPYIVTEVIPGGAYRLKDKQTGKDEGNPWNVAQLRRFYA